MMAHVQAQKQISAVSAIQSQASLLGTFLRRLMPFEGLTLSIRTAISNTPSMPSWIRLQVTVKAQHFSTLPDIPNEC